MHKGGAKINKRTAQIIRYLGLMLPVVLMFYGLLIQNGAASSSHYLSDTLFFVIMIPWVVLASYQFLFVSKQAKTSAVRLVLYHILAGAYILFISGFATPFIAAWILLFLASYIYFSSTGMKLSGLTLTAIVAIDVILHVNNGTIILVDIMSLLSVLIVGIAAISISRIQEIDGAELSKSKAQENLQRDRILTIVNNLADAVISTDKDGIIRIYNAACLNLLDTNTSLDGVHIDKIMTLYSEDDTPVPLFEELQKSRNVVVRDDLTATFGGETLRLETTFSPIKSSYSQSKEGYAHDGYILIFRDVTKTKSLEEERDEFISVISHELRTPITIAEGTISNVQLMMARPNIPDKILRDGINTAHDQVMFLSKMVNDLSTLSRAERGIGDEAEEIDVRSLVDELFADYSPQAAKKDLQFNLDTSARLGHVVVSRLYLHELLQNFITNSIKYTKEGSVTLEVNRKNDKIVFTVKDTGIGISKGDQAKIFKKFYRSEDYRTRENGGTGLGLYVAKKLAHKINTKIELTSRLNHGSSFSFTLPVIDKTK